MNVKRILKNMFCFTIIGCFLSGCGSSDYQKAVNLNNKSKKEIIAKAKKEGELNSVGMPDSWANWEETWKEIKDEYGIDHKDTDMSSAEEIAIFKKEKSNASKDIGDVGQNFGEIAEEEGVTQKYKTSYWKSVPNWAKDDDGDWIVSYTGTMSIMVNNKIVKNAPKSFDDLLKGDYKVAVGDVGASSQAQFAVLAAAKAYGGDENNLEPGIKFFQKLAKQGRLDLGEFNQTRIEKGEIGVAFLWDFNALGYRNQFEKNNSKADFSIYIPKEGSVRSGYCTIINKYSKHPYSAALAREYILSDEGQINLAKGFAKPIREDVKLPKEVKDKLLDDSQYKNIYIIKDQKGWDKSLKNINQVWQEEVVSHAK